MRRRLEGEEGIALTVAIMALALMITLGGVALNQAVNAVRSSTQQADVKRALQAADAAIDTAAYGLSRLDIGASFNIDPRNPSAGLSQSCLVSTESSAASTSPGWTRSPPPTRPATSGARPTRAGRRRTA